MSYSQLAIYALIISLRYPDDLEINAFFLFNSWSLEKTKFQMILEGPNSFSIQIPRQISLRGSRKRID